MSQQNSLQHILFPVSQNIDSYFIHFKSLRIWDWTSKLNNPQNHIKSVTFNKKWSYTKIMERIFWLIYWACLI